MLHRLVFSIDVPKSPAVCRFESTSTLRWGSVNGTSSKADRQEDNIAGLCADGTVFFLRTNQASMLSLLTEDYGYGESMDENIVERDRYGGGSVMIRGGILVCHSCKTQPVTVN